VNGDGRADVVGFGASGTNLALANQVVGAAAGLPQNLLGT